jgi:hypothetical protein
MLTKEQRKRLEAKACEAYDGFHAHIHAALKPENASYFQAHKKAAHQAFQTLKKALTELERGTQKEATTND